MDLENILMMDEKIDHGYLLPVTMGIDYEVTVVFAIQLLEVGNFYWKYLEFVKMALAQFSVEVVEVSAPKQHVAF